MKCLKISSRYDLPFNIHKYDPQCLISIKDIHAQYPLIVQNFKGPKLLLTFQDILQADTHDLLAPNKKHIHKIIAFAINNRGKTFIANCTAGISRSSAVAYVTEVISSMTNPADVLFKLLDKNPNIYPNDRILKIASQMTHIDFFTPFEDLRHIMNKRLFDRLELHNTEKE